MGPGIALFSSNRYERCVDYDVVELDYKVTVCDDVIVGGTQFIKQTNNQ